MNLLKRCLFGSPNARAINICEYSPHLIWRWAGGGGSGGVAVSLLLKEESNVLSTLKAVFFFLSSQNMKLFERASRFLEVVEDHIVSCRSIQKCVSNDIQWKTFFQGLVLSQNSFCSPGDRHCTLYAVYVSMSVCHK